MPAIVAAPKRTTTVYVAQLKSQADLAPLADIARGPDRRVVAWRLLTEAAERSRPAIEGVLQGLSASRAIHEWSQVPLANSLILTVDRTQEAAVEQALRGSGLIQSLERDVLAPGWLEQADTASTRSSSGEPDLELVGDKVGVPWNIGRIRADRAWKQGIRGEGVTVGVFDTGVHTGHAALRHAYRGSSGNHDHAWFDPSGASTVPGDSPVVPHGTAVASNIVGETAGSKVGVAPGATLIAATMGLGTDPTSTTGPGPYASALLAWQWMLAPTDMQGGNRDPRLGADIINNSWRFPPGWMFPGTNLAYDGLHSALGTAAAQLDAAGILSVAGAGNEGPDRMDPASMPSVAPHVLTVGATTKAGAPWRASSRGPVTREGVTITKPDLAAPGLHVPFAWGAGDRFYLDGMATSIAAPQVTGAAALLLSAYPNLEPREIRSLLTAGARDIGPDGVDEQAGWGLVDVERSLEIAARLHGPPRVNAARAELEK